MHLIYSTIKQNFNVLFFVGDKFEGNRNEKMLKIVECRVSIVRFIIQQLIFMK